MNERDIFVAALQLCDAAHRQSYLDGVCGGDPAIREHIEGLLKAHEAAGDFLELGPITPPPEADLSGTVIGSYRLIEQLGEGGFGIVMLAEQSTPVRRLVALKVLKAGMDSRQVVARFDGERQALAIMDHPNIAKVYDGGVTPAGRPYFVMELVKGVPITDFCDHHHLTPRQRLELFISVCHAVQHAHQKGIIHRDLKPSNILVAVHDGKPVAKVIDFGVAKAIGPALTDHSVFTGYAQMIGTPLYMSPEQAGQGGRDVDTRTDVYSLGVLLYELLTGTTPFDKDRFKRASSDEIRRIIRDEDPPRPSTRLEASNDTAQMISDRRRTQPARLTRLLRGELDWIVMKAMEKDRERRYETANGFGQDVQRYLDDEPVQAGPPSQIYRLRKFVRRRRGPVLAASVTLLALLVGFVGTTTGLVEADQAAADEIEQRKIADGNAANARMEEGKAKVAMHTAKKFAMDEKAARDRAEVQLLRAESLLYASQVNFAQQAWESHNLNVAHRYLNACRADFRGWEHRYIAALLRGIEHRTLHGHNGSVACIARSGDGKRIVSGGQDGTIRIWDPQPGKALRIIQGHTAQVGFIALSDDGKKIVSGHSDPSGATITAWNADSGDEIRTIKRPKFGLTGMASSRDATRIVTGYSNGEVQLWNFTTGECDLTIKAHSTADGKIGDQVDVAFDSDNNRIMSSGRMSKKLKVWDATNGREVLAIKDTVEICCIAQSLDGKWLIRGGEDGSIRVWDRASGENRLHVTGHGAAVSRLAVCADGKRIVSASRDGTIRVWDAVTGQEIRTFTGHRFYANCVAASADGRHVVSGSSDATIKIWDTSIPVETPVLAPPSDFLFRTIAAMSPDNKRIATATVDGELQLWDAATGNLTRTIKREGPGNHYVAGLEFSADGKQLVGSYDRDVRVWNADSGEVVRNLEGHTHGAINVILTEDDNRLVSVSKDGTVKHWDNTGGARTVALEGFLGMPNQVVVICLRLSRDAKQVVGGWSDGNVQVWDAGTGKRTLKIQAHPADVATVAWSRDGQRIVSSGSDKLAKVWNASTGENLATFPGNTDSIISVAWMPDGKRVVSGSYPDYAAKIWDPATGFETLTLKGTPLAISADGQRILYLAANKTIRIWSASTR